MAIISKTFQIGVPIKKEFVRIKDGTTVYFTSSDETEEVVAMVGKHTKQAKPAKGVPNVRKYPIRKCRNKLVENGTATYECDESDWDLASIVLDLMGSGNDYTDGEWKTVKDLVDEGAYTEAQVKNGLFPEKELQTLKFIENKKVYRIDCTDLSYSWVMEVGGAVDEVISYGSHNAGSFFHNAVIIKFVKNYQVNSNGRGWQGQMSQKYCKVHIIYDKLNNYLILEPMWGLIA